MPKVNVIAQQLEQSSSHHPVVVTVPLRRQIHQVVVTTVHQILQVQVFLSDLNFYKNVKDGLSR